MKNNDFRVYIVYAHLGKENGWAILGAKNSKDARTVAYNGWLEDATIDDVVPIERSMYKASIDKLKSNKKYPKKHGEYFELEWGS